jgi:hypothetical protein
MNLRAASKVIIQTAKRLMMPPDSRLLDRDTFIKQVKLRTLGYCACCNELATEAHQILDRRLYPDDGYYLSNGVALCNKHHKLAEITVLTVNTLRHKVAARKPVLPPGFKSYIDYDKWGNVIANDDMLILGPLKNEPACIKALIVGKKAHLLYEALPVLVDVIKPSVYKIVSQICNHTDTEETQHGQTELVRNIALDMVIRKRRAEADAAKAVRAAGNSVYPEAPRKHAETAAKAARTAARADSLSADAKDKGSLPGVANLEAYRQKRDAGAVPVFNKNAARGSPPTR